LADEVRLLTFARRHDLALRDRVERDVRLAAAP
jgi:hypothetical protein